MTPQMLMQLLMNGQRGGAGTPAPGSPPPYRPVQFGRRAQQSAQAGLANMPQMQQMQDMATQLQMQQAQATIQKTTAEAAEENAKALKHQAEAAALVPTEIDAQAKAIRLQREAMGIEKDKVDMANTISETARNLPEVEHLKSETILNLARAQQAGKKSDISTRIQ